ncbi:MAG: TonB-dependent receptor [Phaeodactylibacter sp.]|nr:TonB-dependent receptor [Phaeodactylibacter sp.]
MFVMKACLPLLLTLTVICARAQTGTLSGKAVAGGEPVPYASIALEGTSLGVASGEDGFFELPGIPPGTYRLVISALGYHSWEQEVQLGAGQKLELGAARLEANILNLQEAVVTGTMKKTFLKDSPVKVEVISGRYLEQQSSPATLIESMALINGAQEVVACGVCGTNNISLNGLPGAYTAVLMDGSPIYGNLAAVYGLNGIPRSIIERIEVIRGPSSTLYGSEAVAGVINVITKHPGEQPLLSADIMGTTNGESFGNLAFAPRLGKWRTLTGVDYGYTDKYSDKNGDGFGDFVNLNRLSFFTKWELEREGGREFSIFGKFYSESRRNGVEEYVRDGAWRRLRGSGDVYGESIFTRRGELFGAYELPAGLPLKLDYSLSYHYQDSYYGADFYEAEQAIAFANLTYPLEVRRHSLLFGLTSRWQSYDDNTVATAREPSRQFIPGVFVQDEWAVADQLTLLSGARLDHYGAHGLIFAPRLNLKYSISDWTSLRLNGGTGFRIVNLFTEDHAFISGQREVVIEESLQPERSYNAAANLHHIYTLGNSQGTMDIDVFFTHFTNKIIPDYSVPGQILYSNTEGHARTAGLSLSLSHQFRFPLSAQLGFNWQRATQTEPDADGQFQTRLIEFAQQWSGVGAFNYNWKKTGITFAYTLNVSGPMALPETFDFGPDGQLLPASRPTESDPFLIHALQVSKAVPAWKLDLYGGVQNLLDYRQPFSPLVGYNDPNARAGFSQNFDTSYAYGPMQGREFYLGLRWSL